MFTKASELYELVRISLFFFDRGNWNAQGSDKDRYIIDWLE